MEMFDKIFQTAAANVPPEYFRLLVAQAPEIYRERAYCYELYHQMRSLWLPANQTDYRLCGEVDKRGHPYFAGDKGASNPDFIVHIPGTDDNYAVIEVKTRTGLSDRGGLEKDIETLLRFVGDCHYRRAIHLVFGASARATVEALHGIGIDAGTLGAIEFWGHEAPGAPAVKRTLD
jgi:hypothetical protein